MGVIVAGVTLTSLCGCKHELKLKQGDELHGILEEAVLEVSLRGPRRRADARRFRPEQPFRFSFEDEAHADGEHCGPSSRLTAALARLFEIRVRRVLSDAESRRFASEHPADRWSALEIRSIMTDVDTFRLNLLMDAKGSTLYAKLPDDSQVFTVDANKLALLSLHCPSAREPQEPEHPSP